MNFQSLRSAAVLAALASASLHAQPAVFATGLIGPEKMILGPGRSLIVSEAGRTANGGRVSIVTSSGVRRSLLEALPAGVTGEGSADGPSGLFLDENNTLYITIGEGDQLVNGTTPPTQMPNPKGPASPILATILKVVFSVPVDQIAAPFTLRAADHNTLADGGTVTLENGAATATVSVLADFRYRPDPVMIYRNTHPYSLTKNPTDANTLYMGDAGLNSVVAVNLQTGKWRVLARFAPQPNGGTMGAPVVDAVPDSIRWFNGRILVTLLTGFPFAPGNSKVMSVDPMTGASEVFIPSLTSTIDILPRSRFLRPLQYFVLEHSANLLAGAPGRVRLIGPGTSNEVIAGNLNGPTSLFYDATLNALYVTSRNDGTIVRIDLQN